MARQKRAKPGPKGLSKKIKEQMFRVYVEGVSLQKIGEAFTVSRQTVDRIRRDEDWKSRREKILRQARQKVDDRAAYKLTEELMAVNKLSKSMIPKIVALVKAVDGKLANPAELATWEYDKLHETLLSLKREWRELVRLKKDLLEVVEPELPPEPDEVDKVTTALNAMSAENLRLLAEAAVAEIAKNA